MTESLPTSPSTGCALRMRVTLTYRVIGRFWKGGADHGRSVKRETYGGVMFRETEERIGQVVAV